MIRPKIDTDEVVQGEQADEGEGKLMAMDLSQEIFMYLGHQGFLGDNYRTRGSGKTKKLIDTERVVQGEEADEGEGKLMAMDLSQEISMYLWHQGFLGDNYRTRGTGKTKNRYRRGGAGRTSR